MPCLDLKIEPVATVGEPPACERDGNRGAQRPPKRQRHIGDQAQDREGDPEYFLLHSSIVCRIASSRALPMRNQVNSDATCWPGDIGAIKFNSRSLKASAQSAVWDDTCA